MKAWSQEEIQYLHEHSETQAASEIARHLGRSVGAVSQKRLQLNLPPPRPPWSSADEFYLMDKWGTLSIPAIAKKLNRSISAIKVRAARLGLGAVLMGGEYITLNQLLIAVTGANSAYSYKMTSWVKNRGLPIHTKQVEKNKFRVVYLEEFWKWAEKNRSFIDFSKMEPLALGKEPAWVAGQRKKDFTAFAEQRKDPWTPGEDDRLTMLLKQHKYGYAELSDILNRSAGAIQRRVNDLGLKERPVKADNRNEWTEEDYRALSDGLRNGDSYTAIAKAVGRSEKAVRGKVYFVYLTENADKIREMMKNGSWGDGAPVPTVKQGVVLSRCRTAVRNDLSSLAGLLVYRRNELGYEPYWQKSMCTHWHDIKGCTAGGTDCDSCTDFQRIRPQYCARCGCTFLEREEIRFCAACRLARKRQHQRKWRRLYGGSAEQENE